MHTFKFVGLAREDAETPYCYGSLSAKPELGQVLSFEPSGNRYAVYNIHGEGLFGDANANQRELAYADVQSDAKVPTLFLQRLARA